MNQYTNFASVVLRREVLCQYLTWLMTQAKDAELTDTEAVRSLLSRNVATECLTK